MRVLLIKTSSMGDLIHTLPALTDAVNARPDITFDWVVEDAFADIPSWHPSVKRIIPVALRRWRKGVLSPETRAGWKRLKAQLRGEKYDLILDAQGLVKSAMLTFLASGPRAGLDRKSARESLASFAYQKKYSVNFHQHAVHRMRQLFSLALNYPLPATIPDFGVTTTQFASQTGNENYLVFLFGTTWNSKLWPASYWAQLAKMAGEAGYRVKVSGNHPTEHAFALSLAAKCTNVDVLPRFDIPAMAALMSGAKAVVSVDTGLGHLAAALNVPTVSIYGSTNPAFTGALGASSIQLAADFPCSPCLSRECHYSKPAIVTPACYSTVTPERVWTSLKVAIHTLPF